MKGRGRGRWGQVDIVINRKAFYDEKNQYSYGQRSCGSSAACHYTQVGAG